MPVDPNMGFTNPVVLGTVEPDAEQDVSNALTTIGGHTHTGAPTDGKKLPAAALAIDGDVSFKDSLAVSHNVVDLRTSRYTDQGSTLSASGDVDCVYFVGGDMYANDGSGTAIKLTSGGAVNVTTGPTTWKALAVSSSPTILASDTYTLYLVDTGGARTITMPAAGAVTAGRLYVFLDKSGTAQTHPFTILRAGADTIAGATSYVVSAAWGGVMLLSDGSSKWVAISVYNAEQGNVTTGAAPALTGAIALSKVSAIKARNNAGSQDISLVATDASDNITIGDATNAVGMSAVCSGNLTLQPTGFLAVKVSASGVTNLKVEHLTSSSVPRTHVIADVPVFFGDGSTTGNGLVIDDVGSGGWVHVLIGTGGNFIVETTYNGDAAFAAHVSGLVATWEAANDIQIYSNSGKYGFGVTPVTPATYTTTNHSTSRSLDETGATTTQVAHVLGTLLADLKLLGITK
jgi:hypothetical protein